MITLVKLVLAHLIGDFLLQPRAMIQHKERRKAASPLLYVHILIHMGLVLLLLWDLTAWPLALMIGAGHWLIDLAKIYIQPKRYQVAWFAADQILHLLLIAVLWWFWFEPEKTGLELWIKTHLWIYLTAIFFLALPAGIILRVMLSSWSERLAESRDESLADAGTYIGILERLLVFIFIISGRWEGVGFLFAAKSVFRFGDLRQSKDRKLTEYFLIGTLLSFGIAIVTTLLAIFISKLL